MRELDLGEILAQTFNLYFSNFFLFFVPFLVAGFLTGAWGKVVSLMFPMPAEPARAPLNRNRTHLSGCARHYSGDYVLAYCTCDCHRADRRIRKPFPQ